jgi:hypothetical protein
MQLSVRDICNMDNFPNNISLKPKYLDLARNLSLHMGYSSIFLQKRKPLIVTKSIIYHYVPANKD